MDFTKKIKSLVNLKQTSRSSIDVRSLDSPVEEEEIIHAKEATLSKSWNNPEVEQDILSSIKEVFYSDENFDASQYKLKEISDVPDINEIRAEEAKLKLQLDVVSKKLSALILQNQTALAEELNHVTQMQKSLEEACGVCVESRSLLAQSKRDFTTASLGILASYRKREKLKCLLRSLYMIKTLEETDVRLRELLEEEDYSGAIQLCLECQKAASTFKHFSCISELSSKLQDTLVMTEEQLDVALSKVCSNFNEGQYEKLQEAYNLLGKTQTAVDQLLMHFATAIHNTASKLVLEYTEKNHDQNFQKRQYPDLCKLVEPDSFTACLENLCKALWNIMYSYWCILEWHEIDEANKKSLEDSGTTTTTPDESIDCSYIKQKLEHGRIRIWQDVQQKVKGFLLASDLSSFKFDEFIHILALIQRLMDVGEDFCGSRSEELQESVRKQSVNYFRNYHRGFMEELRTFLENESWEICPVHSAFSAVHLQEFYFLRHNKSFSSSPEKSCSPVKHQSFFLKNPTKNPFEERFHENDTEDIFCLKESETLDRTHYNSDSDDSEIPDELKKDFIDENTEDIPRKMQSKVSKHIGSGRKKPVPILTNTALNVLRSFGKYMQMMSVLKPIAFDVLLCMTHLFDYYMYSVYIFFAKEVSDLKENILSNKLKTTLKRIKRDNLACEIETADSFESNNKDKIPPPSLSPAVNLEKVEDLFGLAERVAAAESLVFLAEQFELLHPNLELLIPSNKKAFLQQFCSQTVSQASELRRPIYAAVSAKTIDYDQIITQMSAVKWDISEIMSQHSQYVDILLRELQVFSMRLSEVSKKVPIPKETYDLLWEYCIKFSNHSFIEGFSQAKKCTNGGRALMQLDYQQFLCKVERLTELQPLPGKELVESYIKAYYMLEQNLEQWIRSHKEYTNKQLISLVNCITQLNKKGRQRLISLIEEGDKLRR
ncbi:syndetin [Parasteatoda tepidariorum]|uniref:syndetin n=1 Tax=Parasteatoda tepidariorum TaxID=114398 RepID=UPI00077FAAAC|nr:syndetin [Parasteatoda tepidariorum]